MTDQTLNVFARRVNRRWKVPHMFLGIGSYVQ